MMQDEDRPLRDLREERDLLRGLLLLPGWKILVERLMADREITLRAILRQPLSSSEQVYSQEFIKGRAFQIEAVTAFPQALIDNLTVTIDGRAELEENDDDSSSDSSSTGGSPGIKSGPYVADSGGDNAEFDFK